MNKVTTIHLNGIAFQVEEQGYDALRKYLDTTAKSLASNPDKEEIMRDFEQAIGEKCRAFLSDNKNVVSEQEIRKIIEEMGPVNEDSDEHAESAGSATSPTGAKRLYRVHQGSVIGGVCMGLSEYFSLDVALIRVIFVLLVLITHGGFILVYFVMMLLIPRANSPEERAAARGQTFNAQGFMDQARQAYGNMSSPRTRRKWEREWKQREQEWKYEWKHGNVHGAPPAPAMMLVHTLLGLMSAFLAIVWILALLSLISNGMIFGYAVTSMVPLWAAILLLIAAYFVIKWPIRLFKYNLYRRYSGQNDLAYGNPFIWFPLASAFIWLSVIVAVGWFVHGHSTEVGSVLESARLGWEQLIETVRNAFN